MCSDFSDVQTCRCMCGLWSQRSALCDAIMSETLDDTTKITIIYCTVSVPYIMLLCDVLAIAKFLADGHFTL